MALFIAAALLPGCTARPATPPAPPGDTFRAQLVEQVTADGAWVHIEALQSIADATGGNRASPGPGYDASVDHVAGVLREAGFDTTTPVFTLRSDDRRPITLRNVVAQTRTGDPERVVVAGAHLDSVPDGPGINDNASGVAALLEVATRMGGSPPTTNAVRFAFWAAEERNLDGSAAYVESLSRSERRAIILYLNADMAASPNAGYFVQGGFGDEADETGPEGSEVVGRTLVEELAATGATAETAAFDDESDHDAFIEAGIPTGGVFSGADNAKTDAQAARWGGRAGVDFDPCYHSACDRAEGIDRRVLDDFTDALAGTVARFATATDPLAH
ncbi:MAG TPA: M20/M25/M40 family metallo-hydrolase [Pseudonocardia sp.]|jgi:aminopeptidase S|uniref:M20/M25/M40 family metallo-hydrolase n=1 Tax=Pseudonocardia sp. TaxID=60912 RepID=UPI002B4B8000|nr:M20/M25/M40 family metallo-hydrolase [Pseudonocardia sp.]HLU59088.1 M20/M25/M40 family metallo-hydrolase [Pseudonocardia sp.]